MKLFHLSDLHIGKMLNGYSLRESQKNAFLQILKYAEEEKPDAILICGDIYDKSVPRMIANFSSCESAGSAILTERSLSAIAAVQNPSFSSVSILFSAQSPFGMYVHGT